MLGCCLTSGMVETINQIVIDYKKKTPCYYAKIFTKNTRLNPTILSANLTNLEKRGFIHARYLKHSKGTIKTLTPTDDLIAYHTLVTLTLMLFKRDQTFYEIAPAKLQKVIEYIRWHNKEVKPNEVQD